MIATIFSVLSSKISFPLFTLDTVSITYNNFISKKLCEEFTPFSNIWLYRQQSRKSSLRVPNFNYSESILHRARIDFQHSSTLTLDIVDANSRNSYTAFNNKWERDNLSRKLISPPQKYLSFLMYFAVSVLKDWPS